jgi:CheY-like chemotaxis protein
MAFRLLVADDSITIQKIVSIAFENEAVEVEGVGDGQEAFDRIAKFNPDIVLADVDMPGLNGFELSTKIKSSPETNDIKVLLLASDFEGFDEQRYKTCGANNHISKPFKSDDIVKMVKSLLDGSFCDEEGVQPETNLKENSIELELAGSKFTRQREEDVEVAAEDLDGLKVLEPQEEPSLDELLDSVEQLSADGMKNSGFKDEEEPSKDGTPAAMNSELVFSELLQDPHNVEEELPTPVASSKDDDDIIDQMIRGVEELKESAQSPDSDIKESEVFSGVDSDKPEGYIEEPEIFSEVRSRKIDDMDDLNSTFKELAMGGNSQQVDQEYKRPELSSLGGIVPEPEDLLEIIAPGAFSEVGRRPVTPEDIKENLDYISGFSDQDRDFDPRNSRSRDWGYESEDDRLSQVIAEEVKQVMKRALSTSLEQEFFGLSEVILKTIREVVREVVPDITRKVIREEIEKIKKQDT